MIISKALSPSQHLSNSLHRNSFKKTEEAAVAVQQDLVSFGKKPPNYYTAEKIVKDIKKQGYQSHTMIKTRMDMLDESTSQKLSKKFLAYFNRLKDRIADQRKAYENTTFSTIMETFETIKREASQKKCANCGENAYLAYGELVKQGIKPYLILLNVEDKEQKSIKPNTDHLFCVINTGKDFDATKPSTWGPDALIVDPWIGFVARPQEAISIFHHFYNSFDDKTDQFIFRADHPEKTEELPILGDFPPFDNSTHNFDYMTTCFINNIPKDDRDKVVEVAKKQWGTMPYADFLQECMLVDADSIQAEVIESLVYLEDKQKNQVIDALFASEKLDNKEKCIKALAKNFVYIPDEKRTNVLMQIMTKASKPTIENFIRNISIDYSYDKRFEAYNNLLKMRGGSLKNALDGLIHRELKGHDFYLYEKAVQLLDPAFKESLLVNLYELNNNERPKGLRELAKFAQSEDAKDLLGKIDPQDDRVVLPPKKHLERVMNAPNGFDKAIEKIISLNPQLKKPDPSTDTFYLDFEAILPDANNLKSEPLCETDIEEIKRSLDWTSSNFETLVLTTNKDVSLNSIVETLQKKFEINGKTTLISPREGDSSLDKADNTIFLDKKEYTYSTIHREIKNAAVNNVKASTGKNLVVVDSYDLPLAHKIQDVSGNMKDFCKEFHGNIEYDTCSTINRYCDGKETDGTIIVYLLNDKEINSPKLKAESIRTITVGCSVSGLFHKIREFVDSSSKN